MLFNSTEFVVFFPLVAALFFALPHRFRWPMLLAASYYFYVCWKPGYIVLILFSTLLDYTVARFMDAAPDRRIRRRYLYLSLVSNLGLLGFFKYYGFFNETLVNALALLGVQTSLPPSPFLLPVGISFYTFQSLSYLFEVYWGRQHAERHLGRFALYIAFFPQLVAGPIERSQSLLPQFLQRKQFDYDRVTSGLRLMLWGMFKKVVIADRLAQIVDQVYGAPTQFEGATLCMATVFFAFQIFCDFSGYSDIAIGTARVLGFDLMQNFRRPYFAASVTDFWRRWHISLSTWFRDYVYIPLGGNQCGAARWHANILIVFLVSGLWHGADWKFVAWGGCHGLYIVIGNLLRPVRQRLVALTQLDRLPRLHRLLQGAATFILVCYAWIFFRANSIGDALHISGQLFQGWGRLQNPEYLQWLHGKLPPGELRLSVALILLLLAGQALAAAGDPFERLKAAPLPLRWAVYSALVWGIFIFGVFQHKEFIYFTF